MMGLPAYLLLALFYWLWLDHQLRSGMFPLNADSLGIPFAGFLALCLSGLCLIFLAGALCVIAGLVLDDGENNGSRHIQ
jgi:hypothetical protein